MNYSKYYNLETYLFNEVNKNFKKRKYLLPEEFFCIVIWKANRSKTKIKKKILALNNGLSGGVKLITNDIYKAKSDIDKLNILLKKYKFYMPMASAILSVLYPDKFSVYDVRVREQLNMKEVYSAKKYFNEFLPKIKEVANGKTLRDKDKYLWGKSFFEDLKKLVK